MSKDRINIPECVNGNNGKILFWMALAFLFIQMVSGITLVIPGVEIFYVTPNVINFCAAIFITIRVVILVSKNTVNYKGLFTSLGFVLIYLGYLLSTSLWAEYPDKVFQSIKFDLLDVFSFSLFYLFSLNSKTDKIVNIFLSVAILGLFTTILMYIINPEISRLGPANLFALSSTFCIYSIATDERKNILRYLLYSLIISFVVISMHKTSILMLVIGNILVLVIKTGSFKLKRKYVLALVSALVVFLLIFIASEDARNLSLVTYSRFTADTIGDGESNLLSGESDKFRGNIYNYANELIKDNWLFGIGYLNFMPLYAVEFNMPDQITPTGKIVSGTSVHNSYQAWLLEGGIPLVVIVVSILFRYFKILRQRIKLSNSERDVLLYKVLAIVMIQQLAYGLYHTVQHTQMFWMSLGFVFALKYKFSIEDALGERHRTRDYSSKSEYRKKIITATSPVV